MDEINIVGTVECDPVFSHEYGNQRYYKFTVLTKRLSGIYDRVICHINESRKHVISSGEKVSIRGEIRTFRMHGNDGKNHLQVFVTPTEILHDEIEAEEDNDFGFIDGEIQWILPIRRTPRGRLIIDFSIKSQRPTKYDTIPCIAWGDNAEMLSEFKEGDHIRIKGRLQSREYLKRYDNGDEELKTAYEFSVFEIEGRQKWIK